MSENQVDAVLTDDDILSFTQRTRRELVGEITKNGMPTDPKDRNSLLQALSDMDSTALNNKKLGAQQKVDEADRIAGLAIARFFEAVGNNNPFENNDQGIDSSAVVAEIDDARLPKAETVPGETDTGLSNDSYETFMERVDEGPKE